MRSMTGFGTATADSSTARVTVEVRGVNQRFLDVRVLGAREYAPWEAELRERVRARVERGRVDVSVSRSPHPGRRRYVVHARDDLARAYLAAARRLRRSLALAGGLNLADVLALPELLEVREQAPDVARELPALRRALAGALAGFERARRREGRALQADMRRRVGAIEGGVRRVRRERPALERQLVARVRERVARHLGGAALDMSRLAQEVAQEVVRGDVTEELVRLGSHLGALRAALGERGAVGKRIEFLLQEVQRELNTTGAKLAAVELASPVLRAKEEVEKLREQVQNVE